MTIHALATGKLFGAPSSERQEPATRFAKATLVVVARTTTPVRHALRVQRDARSAELDAARRR